MTNEEKRQLDREWEATGYPELGIGFGPVPEDRQGIYADLGTQHGGTALNGVVFGLLAEAVVAVVLFAVYEVVRFWMR